MDYVIGQWWWEKQDNGFIACFKYVEDYGPYRVFVLTESRHPVSHAIEICWSRNSHIFRWLDPLDFELRKSVIADQLEELENSLKA